MTITNDIRGAARERTVAAIDLGSNSFHMLVARQRGDDLRVVDRLREAVRLGAGIDEDGNLDESAMQRALSTLEKFGQRIRGLPRDSVRAIGTNALREARNSKDFLRRAKRALGYSIDVVSGIEEARLIYAGVAHSLAVDEETRFVVDIGGGSTEVIIGRGAQPKVLESLGMGCVSITERFFHSGEATRKSMRAAQLYAHQQLEAVAEEFRQHGWSQAVGASGTLRSLQQLCRSRAHSDAITLDALRMVEQEMVALGSFDAYTRLGVSEDRSPVIAGGLCILVAVIEALGIERIVAAEGALREGLLLDLVGRLERRDTRDVTVTVLGERYRVDARHADRVARTARRLFEQCRESWKLGGDDSFAMLGWASRLFEVGLAISHSGFHKHGAYVLQNADLAGFSRQEQQVLATLVRAHRRRFPKQEFAQLSEPWDELALRLAVLLRIAVLLNRSRSGKPLPEIVAECGSAHLSLAFPEGWLDAHPLTLADLEEEREFLEGAGLHLRFS